MRDLVFFPFCEKENHSGGLGKMWELELKLVPSVQSYCFLFYTVKESPIL